MTQRRCTGLVLTTGVLAVLALCPPASASDGPGALCADGNWFSIEYTATYAGATSTEPQVFVRRVPTTGGCASSWAHDDGHLSTAAIAAQCRTGIEARFGPYPITLRFGQPAVLANRADCIRVMTAISSGALDPGRAPMFPGGTS